MKHMRFCLRWSLVLIAIWAVLGTAVGIVAVEGALHPGRRVLGPDLEAQAPGSWAQGAGSCGRAQPNRAVGGRRQAEQADRRTSGDRHTDGGVVAEAVSSARR